MSYATASAAMSGAGLASSVVGSYWSARTSKVQMEGKARLADINARIAELGAQQELAKGQADVARFTLQTGQVKGAQRAALAANGITSGDGSAAEIQASTDLLAEMDKNAIETNAVRSAWGYRTQAANYRTEAIVNRGTAKGISPGMAAASSLLSNGGQVAGQWYALKRGSAGTTAPSGDGGIDNRAGANRGL